MSSTNTCGRRSRCGTPPTAGPTAWSLAMTVPEIGDRGLSVTSSFPKAAIFTRTDGAAGGPRPRPNFIAFRWANQVQRIHRVTGAEVIPNLQACWPDIPQTEETTSPYALYRLGPALPGTPIPSGGHYRASRVWFILDQLLVSQTLHDAIKQSKLIAGT